MFPVAGRWSLPIVTVLLFGCSSKPTPAADPSPVVFEDRLVISDNDDKSPLRIAPAQLPAAGQCRLWYPGRRISDQPRAGSCGEIEGTAPVGSWVLYRPAQDPRLLQVRVIDLDQPGLGTQVRVYDAAQGTYLGSKQRRDQ